ncbi:MULTISPECIES: protein kinase family protein [Chitinophaga]|uniref:hypothetical protein n=1 Tax=Chitinophaga TaxID=79328 RepID=UPI001ADAB319|nr:hypothetical protein [Chitinophaga chungangae]
MRKVYPVFLLLLCCACNNRSSPAKTDSFVVADTIHPAAHNAERPGSSTIRTTLDTGLLLRTWVAHPGPEAPHADFQISKEHFFIVDFDGDGAMPYKLEDRKLTIYYPEYIAECEILLLNKDSLKIMWSDYPEGPVVYTIWKH